MLWRALCPWETEKKADARKFAPALIKCIKAGQAYRIIDAAGQLNLLEIHPVYTGEGENRTITDYTLTGYDEILRRIKAQYDKADAAVLFAKMQQVNLLRPNLTQDPTGEEYAERLNKYRREVGEMIRACAPANAGEEEIRSIGMPEWWWAMTFQSGMDLSTTDRMSLEFLLPPGARNDPTAVTMEMLIKAMQQLKGIDLEKQKTKQMEQQNQGVFMAQEEWV